MLQRLSQKIRSVRFPWFKSAFQREPWHLEIQHHLRNKFIAITLVVFILLIALITCINVALSSSTLRKISRQNSDVYISNNLKLVDNMLKDMSRISLMTFSDPGTQQIIQQYHTGSYTDQLEDENYLQSLFSNLISIREEISGVYIFDLENLIFGYDVKRETNRSAVILEDQPWFSQVEDPAVRRVRGCVLTGASRPGFMRSGSYLSAFERYFFSVAREVNSFSPFQPVGYIMIMSPVAKIQAILEANNPDAVIILVDEQHNIVYEPSGDYLGQALSAYDPQLDQNLTLASSHVELMIQGLESLVSYGSSETSGWTLITVKPMHIVLANSIRLRTIAIITALITFVLAVLLVIPTSRRMTQPIQKLASAMNAVRKGNYNTQVEVRSKDEIGQLTEVFNLMTDRIHYLITDKYEVNAKLQEAELLQKETELLYLRNQINPHFLYNTLDTVRFTAAVNNDLEVADMIYKLSNFFRLNINKTSELVEIRQEIANIQAYFALMKLRYKELIDSYDLDATILDKLMPAFVLQPIVENSVLHGLKENHYKGHIHITCRRSPLAEHDCLITIADDGCGMSDANIEHLNQRQPVENHIGSTHIGIENVQKRLSLYYGPNYRLTFSRNEGAGVTVSIIIRLDE